MMTPWLGVSVHHEREDSSKIPEGPAWEYAQTGTARARHPELDDRAGIDRFGSARLVVLTAAAAATFDGPVARVPRCTVDMQVDRARRGEANRACRHQPPAYTHWWERARPHGGAHF
jgi:hypothetical protein